MHIASSRRAFLAGSSAAALVAAAGWPGQAGAAPLDADAFLKLSEKLTRKDDLDADIAAAMLDAFRSAGREEALSGLMGNTPDPKLAGDIVAAWYSGVSPDPEDTEVLTYTDALMWEAMSYTKPMGYCGGSMGYWAEPPAG